MKGPFVIAFRAHSGSRLLSDAFVRNEVWMGILSPKTKDTTELSYRVPAVREIVQLGFRYAELPPSEKGGAQDKLRRLVDTLISDCPQPDNYAAYGWKQGIMTFALDIVLDTYPEAKVIHLIRDGRDVVMSRVRRLEDIAEPGVRLMVFGAPGVTHYRGERLRKKVVKRYRPEIEMLHWVTAVKFAMRCRPFGDRYMEVFYEDLCRRPAEAFGKICDFLGVPFSAPAREWLVANATVDRIGRWRNHDGDLTGALSIGAPLLTELGYS